MRRPIKPFAVEKRRSGRRIPLPDLMEPAADPAPAQPRPAPPVDDDDDSYRAALRAADALFTKRAEPEPSLGADVDASQPEAAADVRRILPSLDERDPIEELLAEQEATRKKRGRKPRDPSAPPQVRAAEPAQALESTAPARRPAIVIPGYVRGLIFARYARNDEPRPGERWRRRPRKPNW